jgi:virginiamycin B lyase
MVDIDNSQWFIAQFSADGAQIQTQLPIANTTGLTGLVFGPDNAFWFLDAGNNAVGRMTLSGAVTEYPIPTANSAPQNIAVGPDGRMWFTELNAAKLGSITTSGAITEYVLADGTRPQGIASTPPGYQPNGLWFVDLGRGIGKVTLSHP